MLPIRVAGWQLDAPARPAVFARTDQLIAGLERAVDPNDDGDAHDAARIALVPLAEPYAAFADSPEARARRRRAASSTRSSSRPPGTTGPAGPGYGSISGPGGAAGALTVGAADLRPAIDETRVALRTGLTRRLRPARAARRLGACPRTGSRASSRRRAGRLLRPARVQPRRRPGRAAARRRPARRRRAALAARAGASAVLFYGRAVPGGALGLDPGVDVPVGEHPAGRRRRRCSRRCASGALGGRRRSARPQVAPQRAAAATSRPFSSRGLAFDGRLKPDLLASGVVRAHHRPAGLGSVSGSSAAAAVVAGAAALLAQARPELGAAELRGLLVGTARAGRAATSRRRRAPGSSTSAARRRPSSRPSRRRSRSGAAGAAGRVVPPDGRAAQPLAARRSAVYAAAGSRAAAASWVTVRDAARPVRGAAARDGARRG